METIDLTDAVVLIFTNTMVKVFLSFKKKIRTLIV